MGTLLPILDIYSMLIYPFLIFVMYGFSFPYNRVYMQLSLMTLITSSAIIFVQSHSCLFPSPIENGTKRVYCLSTEV